MHGRLVPLGTERCGVRVLLCGGLRAGGGDRGREAAGNGGQDAHAGGGHRRGGGLRQRRVHRVRPYQTTFEQKNATVGAPPPPPPSSIPFHPPLPVAIPAVTACSRGWLAQELACVVAAMARCNAAVVQDSGLKIYAVAKDLQPLASFGLTVPRHRRLLARLLKDGVPPPSPLASPHALAPPLPPCASTG